MTVSQNHSGTVLLQWRQLNELLNPAADAARPTVELDGLHLSVAQVIAVARYGLETSIDAVAQRSLLNSFDALQKRLAQGEIIYGVNTGFGGTADVRTKQTLQLQRVLIRELHYGILPPHQPRGHPDFNVGSSGQENSATGESVIRRGYDLALEHSAESVHLPWTWTRASILIRINSLIKGCSGVRPIVIERMQDLLLHDIIPMIPLRGSISASGDLSPLSYIGGAIQGKSTIRIMTRDKGYVYADEAFRSRDLEPVSLQAKEGLAVVNGTAISCAAGTLALHDAHGLAVLAQILTAMTVEALFGTAESFHPLFAETRPHPGQVRLPG